MTAWAGRDHNRAPGSAANMQEFTLYVSSEPAPERRLSP